MNIVKVETSQGSLGKNIGCEKAPKEILKILNKKSESVVIVNSNLEETNNNIYEFSKKFIGKKTIFLGGDHSITYPIFNAFSKENVGLIIFDAHIDAVNKFNPPSHEDFLKTLVEENIVNLKNIILIGTRCFNEIESKFLEQNKIKYYKPQDILLNLDYFCDSIMEQARNFSKLYISIDIDCLDPAFAPGTGYLEPNGLTTQQLFYLLKRLFLLKNLEWVDLVEINPDKDINNITVKTGAEIVKMFK